MNTLTGHSIISFCGRVVITAAPVRLLTSQFLFLKTPRSVDGARRNKNGKIQMYTETLNFSYFFNQNPKLFHFPSMKENIYALYD